MNDEPPPGEEDITAVHKPKRRPPSLASLTTETKNESWTQHQKSPSSPDLLQTFALQGQALTSPPPLYRSRTMPRLRSSKGEHELVKETEPTQPDPEQIRKIRRWVLCIAIVNFDLDIGPVLDTVYPRLRLSPSERQNIAFSAFPDAAQTEPGSHIHSFRIRDVNLTSVSESLDLELRPPSIDGFLYGFSYFTQKRDTSSKRGYLQRSIVLLSHHPFPALLTNACLIMGPLYLKHGIRMLEAACHNIGSWPDPAPSSTSELGFLGSVLHVELPRAPDEQQFTETISFRERFDPAMHILASLPPPTPSGISLFSACIPSLWSIWECLVLQEPLLVYSSSPAITSQAIWWLWDLTRPLSSGDFRPYFTIHDQDYAALVNKNQPPAGLILGVTNPFIERACRHWPHILCLSSESHPTVQQGIRKASTSLGPAPGYKTSHNRYISKDRILMKQLQEALHRGITAEMEASMLLRRHFASRTTALLVPLNRYLTSLIPSPNQTTGPLATRAPPRLKSFNTTDFLGSLRAHGTPLPFRSASKQKTFYERWIKTNAFGSWLIKQEDIVNGVLRNNSAGI